MTPKRDEWREKLKSAAKAFEEPYTKTREPIEVECICHQELFHSTTCIKYTLKAQPPVPSFQKMLEVAYCEGAFWAREQTIKEVVEALRSYALIDSRSRELTAETWADWPEERFK